MRYHGIITLSSVTTLYPQQPQLSAAQVYERQFPHRWVNPFQNEPGLRGPSGPHYRHPGMKHPAGIFENYGRQWPVFQPPPLQPAQMRAPYPNGMYDMNAFNPFTPHPMKRQFEEYDKEGRDPNFGKKVRKRKKDLIDLVRAELTAQAQAKPNPPAQAPRIAQPKPKTRATTRSQAPEKKKRTSNNARRSMGPSQSTKQSRISKPCTDHADSIKQNLNSLSSMLGFFNLWRNSIAWRA